MNPVSLLSWAAWAPGLADEQQGRDWASSPRPSSSSTRASSRRRAGLSEPTDRPRRSTLSAISRRPSRRSARPFSIITDATDAAVVTEEPDDGVLGLPGFFKGFEHPPDTLVQ